MKQKQLVDLLDSAMPEIAKTGDPEGVLLKTARANNLSPAQLEKFGHVFNTMKTNYILKNASERGGSFSLVNVPKLVENYSTWKPAKKKATIEKSASFDYMKETKYEDLPSFNDWMGLNSDSAGKIDYDKTGGVKFTDESEGETWTAIRYDDTPYDIMHKAASAAPKYTKKEIEAAKNVMSVGIENVKQAAYEAREEIRNICDDLRLQFTPDNGEWAESVVDVLHAFGREKAAAAVGTAEKYFLQQGFVFRPADLRKSAATIADRVFAEDRHGVFSKMEDLLGYIEICKEASAFLEKEAKDDDDDFPDAGKEPRGGGQLPPAGDKEKKDEKMPSADKGNETSTDDGKPKSVPYVGDPEDSSAQDAAAEMYKALLDGISERRRVSNTSLLDVFRKEQDVVDRLKGTGPLEAYQGQKKIDDAVDTASKETTLQQLMLSDPIIANADQDRVRALYDTISEASPMFAKNPHLMGPALKEAIQYDSIPVQQVKDLLGTQKTQLEIERLKAGLPTK